MCEVPALPKQNKRDKENKPKWKPQPIQLNLINKCVQAKVDHLGTPVIASVFQFFIVNFIYYVIQIFIVFSRKVNLSNGACYDQRWNSIC
jgi:hypothetical protein